MASGRDGKPILSRRIWLDEVEIRPSSNEIVSDGQSVRVKPKAMAVLEHLIAAGGEVVTKHQILEGVWSNITVTESVLTDAIHGLRQALSDDPKQPRFIETIPRRGYRLVANIKVADSAGSDLQSRARGIPRIAVLRFSSLSDDPEDQYFCEGLSEDLVSGLGKSRHVEVVARTSSTKVAAGEADLLRIAQRLDASYLVNGSFRRSKERIRVIAHLIEPATGTEIWSDVYDRQLEDLIKVQDDIARSICQAISPRLEIGLDNPLVTLSTANLEAYREFSKGRYFWQQDNTNPAKALAHYQKALELDPGFALPHAGIVECYNTFAVFHLMPQIEARKPSIEHAEQALFLDPASAESQFAFGYMQYYMHWNWQLAELAFNKALAINPNHVLAHCFKALLLSLLQRYEESRALCDSFIRLDPFSPFCWLMRAMSSHYQRDFRDALAAAEQGLELNPEDVIFHWIRADSSVHLGKHSQALDLTRELESRTDHYPMFKACSGLLYSKLGQREDVERIHGQLGRAAVGQSGEAFVFSLVHLSVGEFDSALDSLDKAEQEKDATFWAIACEAYFDPLRKHLRFREMLKRLAVDQR